MGFDLTKPCSNCPFLKKGGIRLSVQRVIEIAGSMLESRGKTFSCHKTVRWEEDEDGVPVDGGDQQHCAGALLFAEKNENATQMMRIAERLGWYDVRKLSGWTSVFDTVEEMMATAI